MDRSIVYAGAGVQDTDILFAQRSAMVALGMLTELVISDTQITGPIVTGLGVQPTAPASLALRVNRGALFGYDVVDLEAYGSLPADTDHHVVQCAVNLDTVTLPPIVAPGQVGQGQAWLLEAQAVQQDAAPMVLPFWNAALPSQPFLGPANTGGTVPTQRVRRVAFQMRGGAVTTSGSQIPPQPDPAWVPLAVVTVVGGQEAIGYGDVRPHPLAPRPSFALTQLAPGFSRREALVASQSWIVPVGVKTLKATLVGGGGGGSSGAVSQAGAGGGAGGMAVAILDNLTPGTTIGCVVGLGGAGGVSGGASGAQGGVTSFATLSATPGQPGQFGGTSAAGGQGGAGYGANEIYPGGGGGDGTLGGNAYGGGGASGPFGGGGRAGANRAGSDGAAPGAGGGGSYGPSPGPGGSGAPGIIILEY